jgi:Zn-dependent peptidase ImmA (M78 family)
VVKLLESKGIVVALIPDDCQEVDAFSAWHDGRPLIFLVRHKGSTSRTRFDAAHELGHLVMHADVAAGSPELERQANRFASAFLLPRESFLPECPRNLNWPLFRELKQRWKVSIAALLKRAYDLECLSEASYRRAFVHLNQTGERRREQHEPPAEDATLIAQAVAAIADEYSTEDLASALAMPSADLRAVAAMPTVLELLHQASALAAQSSHGAQAAVLAGAALETHLRGLYTRNGVRWNGLTSLTEHKHVGSDSTEICPVADAKSISDWISMRNEAVHAENFAYSADQIRAMIDGIRQFIGGTNLAAPDVGGTDAGDRQTGSECDLLSPS